MRLTIYIILLFELISVELIKCDTITVKLQKDEKVWAGVINHGYLMPFKSVYEFNLYGQNVNNQIQPLILTNKGKYIWSENPYHFKVDENKIIIDDNYKTAVSGKFGSSLAEVQRFVRQKYFSSKGQYPDSMMFTRPQYNTWIELTWNQNQKDILEYAQKIIDNGFPPGVLMIDDTWQEDYGVWRFHSYRFPNPKEMINKLHSMGFKVMLWVCPFVSPDQTIVYNKLKKEKALLLEKKSDNELWKDVNKPIIVEWWDGQSALLDFSNQYAVEWFNNQLRSLVNDYGVDGFKFDAGDFPFYPENSISKKGINANQHAELYAQFGLKYPLNEYRACWKMAGKPLAQRLHDKEHSWRDLNTLIPNMIIEGLCGYTFSCPDLIGGGLFTSFLDESTLNQDLIVRSAQCHALMPMMQFSVAPWRILDSIHLDAVKKAVKVREKFTPLIFGLVKQSALNGEPILKSMEYVFPNQNFSEIKDQFMLGDSLLVAPILSESYKRDVVFPKGFWKDENGLKYKGGRIYNFNVGIDRLLYFKRIK